jgi:octaprenyl-diphosphate synthase
MTMWWMNPPCVAAAPQPTRSFGNPASVLVGDFLYSRAFQMMVEPRDMRIMQVLADATNVIAEGEVLQLMNMHDASLDEAAYLHVIRSKTAKLFEASAGGRHPGRKRDATDWRTPAPPTARPWAPPSRSLTTYWTTPATPPKWARTWATICAKARPRLPLIAAMQRGTGTAMRVDREAIETGAVDMLDQSPLSATPAHSSSRVRPQREGTTRTGRRSNACLPGPHSPVFATIGGSALERS